jgi:drug/metabolite transporter (DMT)-like permease
VDLHPRRHGAGTVHTAGRGLSALGRADSLRFLLLAAIWGSSYLFMRVAAPAFGPLPLVLLRIIGATAVFMPWLVRAPIRPLLRGHAARLFILGALNSAIPFSLLAFSMLRLQAGFAAILGATVPMFAVVIDALWWRHRLPRQRLLGLALGLGGVTLLSWNELDFRSGGSGWAVLATLGASACYATAAHFGKHQFAGKPIMLPAAGSVLASAVMILPGGIWLWPAQSPALHDWLAAATLAILCTAAAYLLYYKLLVRASATALTAVTFLIPVFGVLWGALFLHESITLNIAAGMGVTLLGTAFTTGMLGRLRAGSPPPLSPDPPHPPSPAP